MIAALGGAFAISQLVAQPPANINAGIVQGVLKKITVTKVASTIIIMVMVLVMEILYALKAAYARMPTVIGAKNLQISVCNAFFSL